MASTQTEKSFDRREDLVTHPLATFCDNLVEPEDLNSNEPLKLSQIDVGLGMDMASIVMNETASTYSDLRTPDVSFN